MLCCLDRNGQGGLNRGRRTGIIVSNHHESSFKIQYYYSI